MPAFDFPTSLEPSLRFPTTRGSAVGAVASDDAAERARAFDALVRAYWRPVYTHVRLRWRRDIEDARDITQAFFARALEKGQLGGYDRERARFRTYLRASLDHFVQDLARGEGRQKRGGQGEARVVRLSLDFDVAEGELARSGALAAVDPQSIEAAFDQEWTRSLFSAALAALEANCEAQGKRVYLEVFRRYVLDPELAADGTRPSYADVAKACGVAVTDVTNYLSWARRAFRTHVLEALREITADDAELREEARAVLGVELGRP